MAGTHMCSWAAMLWMQRQASEEKIPLHHVSVSPSLQMRNTLTSQVSLPIWWHTPILHQRWLCSKWLPDPSHRTRKSKNHQGTLGCLLQTCHKWPMDTLFLLPIPEKSHRMCSTRDQGSTITTQSTHYPERPRQAKGHLERVSLWFVHC